MNHPVYNGVEGAVDGKPHDRVSLKLAQLLSLARVGVAASDTQLNIDLNEYGFGKLLEAMAELTDQIIDDLDNLQDIPERAAQ